MRASNQAPAPRHRLHALWLAVGWTLVALVVYLSLTPAPVTLEVQEGDKLLHGFAYFVLMSWFANLYPGDGSRARARLAAGFVALGVTLELVQLWTGYRSFDLADIAAGVIGVAAGWLSAPPRLPNYLALAERLWWTG